LQNYLYNVNTSEHYAWDGRQTKELSESCSNEEWGFCVRYLTLMNEEAPQREYPLRELFNGLRWFVRAGCPWRMMPMICPWSAVYQQTQRWLKAGCFEAMAPRFASYFAVGSRAQSRFLRGDSRQSNFAIHT
jgi:transposase